MKQVWFVGVALAVLAGCGSSSSSTPAAPPASPTPTPTPGPVVLSATTIPFQAVDQTITLTATETNYSGTFTAKSSCASVTVPATATSGSFTLTAVAPASSGCTITVTGASSATATATVPPPGGVQLRWYTPQSLATQANPLAITNTPINIIGLGSVYDATLAVSETAFLGTITEDAATAGCTGAVTATPLAAPPSPLPTAAPFTVVNYYDVDATAVIASGCTLSFQDNYVPLTGPTASPAPINVIVTAGSTGSFQ